MSDREGLSDDDAVFSGSEGERLDYSEVDEGESESESEARATSEEEEAVATSEEEAKAASKRKKVDRSNRHLVIYLARPDRSPKRNEALGRSAVAL